MNRREFIAGAATLPASCAPATAKAADPVLELCSMCERLQDHWEYLSETPEGANSDTPEMIETNERVFALSKQVMHSRAESAEGVAAQLRWLDRDSHGLTASGVDDAICLRNAVAALEQLALTA